MRNLSITRIPHNDRAISKQRGIVIPIVVIGLLALLGVAGLALDGSHALGNKTRMQNTVDAAALAAAKVLDEEDGDIGLATAAANSLFSINADGIGNHELNNAYDAGDIAVTVQYSTTVSPFTPGSPNGPFVRVIATGFDTQTTLSRVLGVNVIPTPATAVAGPSGPLGVGDGAEVCDIAPIAVCEDDVAVPLDTLRVLKPNPGVHGDVGPGNYKMLRMNCTGGACLRRNMAGAYGECATVAEPVDTEPGVSSGPVSQGFNTRFNQYQGGGLNSTDYPPDNYIYEQNPGFLKACEDPNDPLTEYIFLTNGGGNQYCKDFEDMDPFDPDPVTWPQGYQDDYVTTGPDIPYDHDEYTNNPGTPLAGNIGVDGRRLLTFPLIDCDGSQNGQSTIMVTGFTCFFMLQALPNGQAEGAGQIFGQYVQNCLVDGSSGTDPGGGPAGPLLYKIQLYKNPDSGDS